MTPDPVSPCLVSPLCHRSAQTRESAAPDNDGNTALVRYIHRYIYTAHSYIYTTHNVYLLCADRGWTRGSILLPCRQCVVLSPPSSMGNVMCGHLVCQECNTPAACISAVQLNERSPSEYPAPATAHVITGLNLPTAPANHQGPCLSAAEFQVFSLHSLGEGQSGIKIQSIAIMRLSGAMRMVKLIRLMRVRADQLR